MSAAEQVAAALALVPSLGDHAIVPGSAAPSAQLGAALALLEQAITLDPACAPAHAARANALVRSGKTAAARRSYALAARLDPYAASVRLALAELAYMAGDESEAHEWFAAAFALTHQYSPAPQPGARSALVLAVAGPWHRNIPLDFIVDPARWTLHRWYVPDARTERDGFRLPACDVVIDAIGESTASEPALAAARDFAATQTQAVINDPRCVPGTARAALAHTLRDVAGTAAATSRRITRGQLAALPIATPQLVRPADAHGGRGLERIDSAAGIAGYIERFPADAYDAGPFVDYRSADGYYRKYRVMFVGGEPFAYHLAIDTSWMIHYHRAPMDAHPWMRAEERAFLADPAAALPGWHDRLPAVAAALGLDYSGIDCAPLPDGTLFVFEADAAMLVHGFDPEPAKRAAYERICAAFDALLARRAG